MILELRDEILRLQGYAVNSTVQVQDALRLFKQHPYDLVLIDVEGDGRAEQAEQLCADIKEIVPDQKVAFVCNYRVAIDTDCPDEIIRAEFNPQALVNGVNHLMA